HRAMVILQRAGNDFRGRGRAAVDQYRQRLAVGDIAALGCETLALVGRSAQRAGRDDLALVQEGIRHRDRLVEQAARIVAQVDDVALQLGAHLALQLVDRGDEVLRGVLVERRNAQIAELALAARTHHAGLDDGAGDLHVEGFRRAVGAAADSEHDVGVGRAAHLLDGFLQRLAHHRLAVEMGDQVAGQNAGLLRRRVVDRRHHLDQAVFLRNLDAESAELAARLHAGFLEIARRQIDRIGIERREHAVDGGFHQLLVLGLLVIIVADALEDLAEQVELPIGLVGLQRADLAGCGEQRHRAHQSEGTYTAEEKVAHQPLTFLSPEASQGSGFTGSPLRRSSKYRTGFSFVVVGPLVWPPPINPTGSPARTHWPTLRSIRPNPANRL